VMFLFLPVVIVWNLMRNYATAHFAHPNGRRITGVVTSVVSLFLLAGGNVSGAFRTLPFPVPGPSGVSVLASTGQFASYWDNQGNEHVDYIGADKHVHTIFLSNNQALNDDLTTESKGAIALPDSALASYIDSAGNQHVNYISADGHVHALISSGSSWTDNDLTALSKGTAAFSGSALDGYLDSASAQHVNYVGTNQHVYELFYSGSSWSDNDLTALSRGIGVASGSTLTGYIGSNNTLHVNFIGTDQHVHELFFSGGWSDNDLTVLGRGKTATTGSGLVGYIGHDNSVHVNFIGTDQHVNELFFSQLAGHWVDNDLTTLSNGAAAVAGSTLTGYVGSNDSI
ncbi:MAG: hypothetical protein ACRDHW_23495, partial [Ktedonobacteraceae bacterium]